MYKRPFQVQTVYFHEIKGPRVGPMVCEIGASNCKTVKFQFMKHIEKITYFLLMNDKFPWHGKYFVTVSVQKNRNQGRNLVLLKCPHKWLLLNKLNPCNIRRRTRRSNRLFNINCKRIEENRMWNSHLNIHIHFALFLVILFALFLVLLCNLTINS